MWPWRRGKTTTSEPVILRGTPARARTKTYSAESGYAYQYVYRGWRALAEGSGQEHVFEVRSGGADGFLVCVRVPGKEVQEAEARIGRAITPVEQYGVVKLSLFAAFDERNSPAELQLPVCLSAEEVQAKLRTLGRID